MGENQSIVVSFRQELAQFFYWNGLLTLLNGLARVVAEKYCRRNNIHIAMQEGI
jgi:hypothetical protein